METIQKIVLKVMNAFLVLIGIVCFSIYVALIGSVIFLGCAPIYIAVNFKEFIKDPLGFMKNISTDIKDILGS